ncbi:MAG: hypothetical protein OEV77_07480 [Nitrospira sp.]|nr:hypothetical protein [Nitrospira sp.]
MAERFGQLSSLSSLDVSVDVQRSVTVLAAQIASVVTGLPVLPTGQESQSPGTSSPGTPGGASVTEAVIPPPSTGATAPTPASPVSRPVEGMHVSPPEQILPQLSSLAQQVLEALRETQAESRTIRKYLPDFLDKLRQDPVKELRSEREHQSHHHAKPATQTPAETGARAVFVHRLFLRTIQFAHSR